MEICPKCNADQEEVFKSLCEGYESDNWQHAVKILRNCKECAEAVAAEFQWLSENIAY